MNLTRRYLPKFISVFSVAAARVATMLLVPLTARAALFKPEPVLQISAIEQDVKSAAQLGPQDLLVLPQRTVTPVTLASGGVCNPRHDPKNRATRRYDLAID